MGDTRRNTRYSDKPNEDLFWFEEKLGAALVLDGVSRDRENGVYPQPSLARLAAEAFARAASAALEASLSETPHKRLLFAVEAGNRAVKQANRDVSSDFLPGTVGVLVLLDDSALHYAYVGDCNGMVLYSDRVAVFTAPQTKAVHDHRGEFTSHEIRAIICNNIHHPCGYGVWTGQSSAMDFLCTGDLPLAAGDRVLLSTDGLNEFLSAFGEKALLAAESRTLLDKAMAFQSGEWCDDRTAVIMEARA